jgi:hypothetical protein
LSGGGKAVHGRLQLGTGKAIGGHPTPLARGGYTDGTSNDIEYGERGGLESRSGRGGQECRVARVIRHNWIKGGSQKSRCLRTLASLGENRSHVAPVVFWDGRSHGNRFGKNKKIQITATGVGCY